MSGLFSYLRVPVIASSGIAALGSSLLYFKQNDIIYPANLPAGARTDVPTPERFHLEDADSLKFPTPDGETLHAYLLRPPNPALRKNITLLTFHGNAGNVGHRLPIGKVLSESLGCHVFMVEYRGYGLSTGAPSEDGLTVDGQTALDYVRNHEELRKTKIVVYGQSLGGAVTVKLVQANQHIGDIAGVILENTFTSIRKLIPSVMPPAKFIANWCHQKWASDETIANITNKDIPILFLSGLKDEIVPSHMMKTLYQDMSNTQSTQELSGMATTIPRSPSLGISMLFGNFLVQEVLNGKQEESKEPAETEVKQSELWS